MESEELSSIKLNSHDKSNNLLLEFLINPTKKEEKKEKYIKKQSYFSKFLNCLFCKK
jgi:hypothetical protein